MIEKTHFCPNCKHPVWNTNLQKENIYKCCNCLNLIQEEDLIIELEDEEIRKFYVVYKTEKGEGSLICTASIFDTEAIEDWRFDIIDKFHVKNCVITFIKELEREED